MPETQNALGYLKHSIIQLLENAAPQTLRLQEIATLLGIVPDTDAFTALQQALRELVDEGIVRKSRRRRYYLSDDAIRVLEGTLYVFAFDGVVRTDHPEFENIFVERHLMNTALHGDRVKVRVTTITPDQKIYGEILRVLHRAQTRFVCTIEKQDQFYFAIPDDEHIHVDFLIHRSHLNGARPRDKVLIELLRWDDPYKNPTARVIEVLGRAGKSTVEFDSIVREFNLPPAFPPEVLKEAERLAREPTAADIAHRRDFRAIPTITIDPTDAKDYDDALSLERLPNGNYRLGVHIADVSHYVPEGSAIDREAFARGTSVYLVDRVIPMLPEVLSTNICSLVPHKDRLTYSVLMEISPRGSVKSYEIVESVINSDERFTYEEVQEIIDGDRSHPLSDMILQLHRIAQQQRKRRYQKGGIDFDNPELRFVLDDQLQPVDVQLKRRTDATSLVEECMLLANRTVAEHIRKLSPRRGKRIQLLPFLYRIHDEPDPEKLKTALELIRSFGIKTPTGSLSSREINQLLLEIDHLPEKFVIHQLLLRAMSKAVYSEYNIGHYGLGFSDYTHFTSPIRRYPDLVVHRLLKRYAREIPPPSEWKQLEEQLGAIADHCSAQERLAMEAERASIKLAQTMLAQKFIGESFNATVTGLLRFGAFVMVDRYYFEGLLRIGEFFDDFYLFNERLQSFIGQRTGKRIHIGSRLHVQLVKVNLERRELDFTYLGDALDGDTVGSPYAPSAAKALLQEAKQKGKRKRRSGKRKKKKVS